MIRLNEHAEKAMEGLKIPESTPNIYFTIQSEIRDRLPSLTEEEIEEVAKLIEEYR